MFYKTKDDKQLYYEVLGNLESEKSIIFLNGLSQSTVAWMLTVPAFTANYKVVLCDLIFQGQSDKTGESRSFDQHATDVIGLIDFLKIKKINVAGISYGSLVAQHMALNFPEKTRCFFKKEPCAFRGTHRNVWELITQHIKDSVKQHPVNQCVGGNCGDRRIQWSRRSPPERQEIRS